MKKFFLLSFVLFILPILINTQESHHLQLTGIWKSNIGLVYEITQEGDHAFWEVRGKEERGEVVFETHPDGQILLQATWHGEGGQGSATGKVMERNPQGKPMVIRWSNGVVFTREPREERKPLEPSYDNIPYEIRASQAWERLKVNTRLKKIRIRPMEEYGSIGIHMLDIRTLLESTGMVEPVAIELQDQEGAFLAHLGHYEPRIKQDLRRKGVFREYAPFDVISFKTIPEVKPVQGLWIDSKTIKKRPIQERQHRTKTIRLLKLPAHCKLAFKDKEGIIRSIMAVMVDMPIYKGYAFHQTWNFKGGFYDNSYNITFTNNFTFKGYKKTGDVYQYFGSTYSVGKYTIGKNTFEFTVSYFDAMEGADLKEVYKGVVKSEKSMSGTVTRTWSNFKKTSGKWFATKVKDHK